MSASGSSSLGPWDPGLQNERTALAWQRTLLSGLACALVVARLLALVSVPAALATGVAALVVTGALALVSARRFRGNARALATARPTADGRAPMLLAALVAGTALGAAAFVLLS